MSDDTFPLDWNEWRHEWARWSTEKNLKRTPSPFKGKNFLADAVLGTFKVNGRTVELSEATFPNLSDRDERGNLIRQDHRYVGITFEDGTDLADSFAALERILGI